MPGSSISPGSAMAGSCARSPSRCSASSASKARRRWPGSLATLPLGALEAFGFAGTLATFGFLVVYFLICLAAPLDQFRAGTLAPRHLLVSGGGTLMMTFVIFGSLYPVPPWPQSLLPYL